MKVIILNGSKADDSASELVCTTLYDELKKNGHHVEVTNLRDKKIAGCLGCFGCWIRTPGECVIHDEGRDIAKAVIQSDLFITVTPITFGGFSYELKKALDRLIPIISPFFMKINGEVHHKPRYEKYPKYISVGILPKMNEEISNLFKTLVSRNAINMHNEVYLSSVIVRDQENRDIISEMSRILKEVGA